MKRIIVLLNLFLFVPLFAQGAQSQGSNSYVLTIPQPSVLNVPGAENEVQGFAPYNGNLYIGYYGDNTNPSLDTSLIYSWNGNTETPFYTLGQGSDFSGVGAIQQYGSNLYFGNQAGYDGSKSGCVYVYNPNTTPVNFIQSVPNLSGGMTNPAITIPNDSVNNAIYGASSFSVEYYGRMDDLGGKQGGDIIDKVAYPTGGYILAVGANNTITATIYAGTALSTQTQSNAFTLGNYHDIIFSWTSGSHPIIYIDGVAASLASSKNITTPGNDAASSVYMSDSLGDTFGNQSYGGTYRRVRIWRNYAVTPSDASILAGGGIIATLPSGQYLFTEGSGTTTADSSGNGNTGTITAPSFWNSTLVDLSYCSGNDKFIYGFAVFKGNLYAGAGYSAGRIYAYNGTTNIWSTSYPGLSGYGLVTSMYVYNGLLFAALGGASGGAIISTPDGINWTVETTVPSNITTQFNRFVAFGGNLYVGIINAGAATGDIYERSPTGTWTPEFPSATCGQVWGMQVYNNNMYIGCTTSGGAAIYKSSDGMNFIQDFQVPDVNQIEAFNMIDYNGSLYIGIGFKNSTSAVVYSKTEPIVAITSPLNGSSYANGSNVTIATTASETNGTIANISLYNGGGVFLGSSTSSPYNFVNTNLSAGNYTYYAIATDLNGLSSTSSPITVTVTVPILPSLPVAAITSPKNGSSFTAGTNISITATASEVNGTINQVQFYSGSAFLGTRTVFPYILTWSKVPAGSYALTAVAIDSNGVSATSGPVTVNVTSVVASPVVTITAPSNGSSVTAGSNIPISVTASETNGTIANISIYNGSMLLGQIHSSSTYSFVMTNVPAGRYTLQASATDANGVTSFTSNVITVS